MNMDHGAKGVRTGMECTACMEKVLADRLDEECRASLLYTEGL